VQVRNPERIPPEAAIGPSASKRSSVGTAEDWM
jgi:hypothetical protein